MNKIRVALDFNKYVFLELTLNQDDEFKTTLSIVLCPDIYELPDELILTISALLNIIVGKKIIRFKKFPASIKINKVKSIKIVFSGHPFAMVEIKPFFRLIAESSRKLTVSETRLLARTHRIDYSPNLIDASIFSPITDLHTHLSAQVLSKDLIKIGLKHKTLYPTTSLDMMGISYDTKNCQEIPRKIFLPFAHLEQHHEANIHSHSNEHEYESAIPLDTLNPEQLRILESNLALNPFRQSTFEDVERCYFFREPFTKNTDLFPDILESIATEYAKYNIQYVELSTNLLVEQTFLKLAEEKLPKIEKRTGVKIRFLLGVPRNLNESALKQRLKKIQDIVISPYIVGIDILGYETNKTTHLEAHLIDFINWYKEKNINCILRFHAGENAKNSTNVKDALLIGIEYGVPLRIGHAIYGIDEQTLELAKALSDKNLLIVEFNPDSNLASNNIDFIEDLPIKKFIDNNIKFVICSDGSGLYQTSIPQISSIANIYNLTDADCKKINHTEHKYINQSLNTTGVPYHYSKKSSPLFLEEFLQTKVPVFIAGAAGTNWDENSDKMKSNIIQCLKDMLNYLDPEKIYFSTGRSKDRGAAIELGVNISLHNFKDETPFHFIAFVNEAKEKELRPKGLSSFKIVNNPLVNLPSKTIKYLKSRNGIAIFFGGKAFSRDFILEAIRQKLVILLMKGPEGASTSKARIYTKYVFDDSDSLHRLISITRPEVLKHNL